jgi:hypothetical protein
MNFPYVLALALMVCISAALASAQEPASRRSSDSLGVGDLSREESRKADHLGDVLTDAEWQRIDRAIDRALTWLAAQQQPDGSFPTLDRGQPGVTSLCVLAFMSQGRLPGEGEYGQVLEGATQYILSCQKPNGLIALHGPEGATIDRDLDETLGVTGAYNHAISSLTLSEMYGMQSEPSERIQGAIANALAATLEMQRWPKNRREDVGGWRYLSYKPESESDLSITGWQLMFLRSARNAGFDVPKQAIDAAVAYVRRTYDAEFGSFRYVIGKKYYGSRAMGGAGVLALAHAGFHNSPEARQAGEWILQHNFDVYNAEKPPGMHDRYHYSLFNCCQGMYQLGSPYWEKFFPPTVQVVLQGQRADGSWDAESYQRDRQFGSAYSTALVVLSLGAPNQFLPVFQR